MRVNCVAQEEMTPARAKTWTAWPVVHCTNHCMNLPPSSYIVCPVFLIPLLIQPITSVRVCCWFLLYKTFFSRSSSFPPSSWDLRTTGLSFTKKVDHFIVFCYTWVFFLCSRKLNLQLSLDLSSIMWYHFPPLQYTQGTLKVVQNISEN